VERVLSRLGSSNIDTLEEVIALDATARRVANSLMQVAAA
jgi:hypothetical protein